MTSRTEPRGWRDPWPWPQRSIRCRRAECRRSLTCDRLGCWCALVPIWYFLDIFRRLSPKCTFLRSPMSWRGSYCLEWSMLSTSTGLGPCAQLKGNKSSDSEIKILSNSYEVNISESFGTSQDPFARGRSDRRSILWRVSSDPSTGIRSKRNGSACWVPTTPLERLNCSPTFRFSQFIFHDFLNLFWLDLDDSGVFSAFIVVTVLLRGHCRFNWTAHLA